MENKKINYFKPLLILAMVILALFVGVKLGRVFAPKYYSVSGSSNSMARIMDYISKYYVDPVNIDSLGDKYIPKILKELDPHSIYIPAAELQMNNEPLEGNFDGIGVGFTTIADTIVVTAVFQGGPAQAAGIYFGDKILAVNDSTVAGKKIVNDSLIKMLRGKSGSKVTVKIQREGENELLPIEITRGTIPINSIDVAYMITPTTGYVSMNKFSKTTYSEFVTAVKTLHEAGMQNLILDLRDNTGGFMDQVIAVTSELFAEKKMIVYTQGRAFMRENKYSEGKGICSDDNIAVLINNHSASASEILAGAVQDNDRGTIIGQRSYGKGLVQHMIDLPNKAGLRLTIARYYTPSGRSIQRPYGHGMSEVKDYYEETNRRYQTGEMLSADSIKQTDTTKYYTANGRVVYGGGGITPDIFVPSELYGEYVKGLNETFLKYTIQYGGKYRNALSQMENTSQLEKFLEDNNPYPGFYEYLAHEGVKNPSKDVEKTTQQIDMLLKMHIGQISNLHELGAFFFRNQTDSIVIKAIDVLEKVRSTPDNAD